MKIPSYSVRVLLKDSDERVLFLQRDELSFNGMWVLPGGKVEMNQTLEEACKDEALQETGLSIYDLHMRYVQEDMSGRILSIRPVLNGNPRKELADENEDDGSRLIYHSNGNSQLSLLPKSNSKRRQAEGRLFKLKNLIQLYSQDDMPERLDPSHWMTYYFSAQCKGRPFTNSESKKYRWLTEDELSTHRIAFANDIIAKAFISKKRGLLDVSDKNDIYVPLNYHFNRPFLILDRYDKPIRG